MNQTIQPIATLFEGKDDEHHNNLVKLCFEIENGNTSVFDKNKKVRDIESIANSDTSSDRKIFNYYAVVQADGDSMGRLLSSLDSDEKVKKFSKQCLNYTTAMHKRYEPRVRFVPRTLENKSDIDFFSFKNVFLYIHECIAVF